LITLFFAISLLKYKFLTLTGLDCLAKELVSISYKARLKPDTFPFPFISLECTGHQKRLPSLIREKVMRIRATKKKMKKLILAGVENVRNGYQSLKNNSRSGQSRQTSRNTSRKASLEITPVSILKPERL
jgi:hypothetical protein